MIALIPLQNIFTIYQLSDIQQIPSIIYSSDFYSITKTGEEISIISDCFVESDAIKSNKGWKGFKVDGILDFSLIGIIHDITKPLKENQISVFVISTFNTDYIFVKEESFTRSIEIFKNLDYINLIHG